MKTLVRSSIYLVSILVTAVVAFFIFIVLTTPNANEINDCLVTKMHKVRLCPKEASYVRLSHISPTLRHAIIVAEDDAFYTHSGFSWAELKNSFYTNLSRKKFARGGSTITQQLAKNVFLTKEKSLLRKIREAILTTQLESLLSKDQILERYLNVVEFGPNIYGIKRASRHYFNKSPADLNILESAYIAYLLPNPKVHSFTFKNLLLTSYSRYRLIDIVYKLYRYKKISESQYLIAKELIDKFPWSDLTEVEIAQISGALDTNNLYQAEESLPEEDQELEKAEITAPPVDDEETFDASEPLKNNDEEPNASENAIDSIDDVTNEMTDTAPPTAEGPTEENPQSADEPFEE